MSDIYKLRFSGNTLCSRQTRQFAHKYKSFKWVLSGRWNQGSGNSGSTATYMEWDELGIAFDGDTVRYGPTYWTYDSYTLDGTPWSPDTRMPQVLLGGSWGSEASKFDASNFVELAVYFHTADNSAILPTRVGLISANNQNEYQSSTPLNFMLYGLNEDTNEYELLIDVNAANVNKSSTTETLVSTGFTYHYSTVTNKWPLSYEYIEPIPDYTLLQTDLRTLGLQQPRQTLGSQISLTNLEHSYICIKFGATNNQNGAGAYDVNMNGAQPNVLRWHSYSSRIYHRAPLCYGRSSVNAQYNAMYKNASGELYFATNSTAFSNGVWAQYKVVIDLQTKYCRVWETTSNSYVEYYLGAIPTTFNSVSCNGDGGFYRSAISNLYVYSAKTWDIALGL